VGFNSICFAALLVIAINSNDLFSAGPQLSFLAVGSLIGASMWIERRRQNPDRLDEMIAATRPWPVRFAKWLWAKFRLYCLLLPTVLWLAALPLVLYQFHILSPIAILISLPIAVIMFFAMWSGFLMLVLGWLAPPIGALCAAICNVSLECLERTVHWAESVPGSHTWLPGPAWWWVTGFYFCLLALTIWGRAIVPPRWQFAALAVWILVGLAPVMLRSWTRSGLDCTVVAVGHGECVLLQAPSGETLLYDAGGIGSPEYATQSIASVLWDRGLTHIDGIVLSHSDTDHYNAVPGLLERFSVGAVYVSTVMFRSAGDANDGGPKVLLDAIHRARVPIREIWSGDQLHVGPDVTVQVLHPPRKGVLGSDNANSVTLGVEYAGRRILLPGDLESPGIDDVMAEFPYDCDVLLAPHHGSRRSDPPGFAAWSTPEWVVLSGGGGEQAAPVIHTYEQSGARVLVTNEVGAVQFKVERDSSLHMTAFRPLTHPVAVVASAP
jgi:competence protein ComEC